MTIICKFFYDNLMLDLNRNYPDSFGDEKNPNNQFQLITNVWSEIYWKKNTK